VEQSATRAKEKGSALLHPCYLKECVKGNEIWDFLEDTVKNLPDTEPEAKKKKGKGKKDNDEDPEGDEQEDEEEEEAPEEDT